MAEWRGDGVWHLWIDATPRPGFANMSVDLTLLDRTERYGERWLRLYGWQPSCLSFGRHEPAARRYDRERIQQLGLDTVRRPTGGRAVWHARELTYAITTPTDGFGSSRFAYLEIHRLILDALGRLGVAGTLAPAVRTAGVGAGSCFARPAGGEVLVDGRKVVGSAQLCRGSGLLQHGSSWQRATLPRLRSAAAWIDTSGAYPAPGRELEVSVHLRHRWAECPGPLPARPTGGYRRLDRRGG